LDLLARQRQFHQAAQARSGFFHRQRFHVKKLTPVAGLRQEFIIQQIGQSKGLPLFHLPLSGQSQFLRQHSRRNNFDALNRLAPEFPEIPFIAREQVRGLAGNGSAENRRVFQRQFSK
jgi:hypothetical protein